MLDLTPQQRLAEWKKFRVSLDKNKPATALTKICDYWSRVPFVEHYLDRLPQEKWPGPWELVYNNHFCDRARALGMIYTWQFTKHAEKYSAELRIYHNHCENEIVNCVCIEPGSYVLNLEYATVLKKHSFNCGYELIHTYPANKLIEI